MNSLVKWFDVYYCVWWVKTVHESRICSLLLVAWTSIQNWYVLIFLPGEGKVANPNYTLLLLQFSMSICVFDQCWMYSVGILTKNHRNLFCSSRPKLGNRRESVVLTTHTIHVWYICLHVVDLCGKLVGKYTLHGWYGIWNYFVFVLSW